VPPSIATACASDAATLLPSPTNAIVRPRSDPQRSTSVWQSASAWQGCSSSVSALTTRSDGAAAAKRCRRSCAKVRTDDAEDPALEIARDVLDRLAAAERDVARAARARRRRARARRS
jgi:hypothetical protein